MNNDQRHGGITDSIVRSSFGHDQTDYLLDLMTKKVSPSELQSLLLMIYDRIVSQRSPADVLRQYDNDRFVCPSDICQRKLTALDSLMFGIVPAEFEAIELSPVAPLGINAVLAHTSQKNVLSAIRNIEVAADITTALAIEAARRRKTYLDVEPRSAHEINLCSSQRSIRMQNFDDIPGFTNHFRVFGAVSAGRDIGHEKFESDNLTKHAGYYLNFLSEAEQVGYSSGEAVVTVSDVRITERIIEELSVNREVVMKSTQDPFFDLFEYCKIDVPSSSPTLVDIPRSFVTRFELGKPYSYLRQIEDKAVEAIRQRHHHVSVVFDLARTAGIGYYESLCFKVSAKTNKGDKFPLADGGLTDWTKKLLASRKERLFISGFGIELFCGNFAASCD